MSIIINDTLIMVFYVSIVSISLTPAISTVFILTYLSTRSIFTRNSLPFFGINDTFKKTNISILTGEFCSNIDEFYKQKIGVPMGSQGSLVEQ